jgi:hypothetical protein
VTFASRRMVLILVVTGLALATAGIAADLDALRQE